MIIKLLGRDGYANGIATGSYDHVACVGGSYVQIFKLVGTEDITHGIVMLTSSIRVANPIERAAAAHS